MCFHFTTQCRSYLRAKILYPKSSVGGCYEYFGVNILQFFSKSLNWYKRYSFIFMSMYNPLKLTSHPARRHSAVFPAGKKIVKSKASLGYLAISFRNKKKSSVVILVFNPAFGKQKQGGMNCTKRWMRRRKRRRRERRMGKELQTIFH